jgi:hypothetical protein
MKKFLLLLAIILAFQRLPAQLSNDSHIAPLFVYINGQGRISPDYDGKMLRVGHVYNMSAIPGRGYKFVSWQLIYIITSITIEQDVYGDLSPTKLHSDFQSPNMLLPGI